MAAWTDSKQGLTALLAMISSNSQHRFGVQSKKMDLLLVRMSPAISSYCIAMWVSNSQTFLSFNACPREQSPQYCHGKPSLKRFYSPGSCSRVNHDVGISRGMCRFKRDWITAAYKVKKCRKFIWKLLEKEVLWLKVMMLELKGMASSDNRKTINAAW